METIEENNIENLNKDVEWTKNKNKNKQSILYPIIDYKNNDGKSQNFTDYDVTYPKILKKTFIGFFDDHIVFHLYEDSYTYTLRIKYADIREGSLSIRDLIENEIALEDQGYNCDEEVDFCFKGQLFVVNNKKSPEKFTFDCTFQYLYAETIRCSILPFSVLAYDLPKRYNPKSVPFYLYSENQKSNLESDTGLAKHSVSQKIDILMSIIKPLLVKKNYNNNVSPTYRRVSK